MIAEDDEKDSNEAERRNVRLTRCKVLNLWEFKDVFLGMAFICFFDVFDIVDSVLIKGGKLVSWENKRIFRIFSFKNFVLITDKDRIKCP